jgi:hypothetical protein
VVVKNRELLEAFEK